ncbi:hypothetical protein ATKI12_2720 [Kitasatospora sp. Ki12]
MPTVGRRPGTGCLRTSGRPARLGRVTGATDASGAPGAGPAG